MEKRLKFKKRNLTKAQRRTLKLFTNSMLDVFVFVVSYLVFDTICSSEFNFVRNTNFVNFFISFVPMIFITISMIRLSLRFAK